VDFSDAAHDVVFHRNGFSAQGGIGRTGDEMILRCFELKRDKKGVALDGRVNLKDRAVDMRVKARAIDALLARPYVTLLRAFRRHSGIPVDLTMTIRGKGHRWRAAPVHCVVSGGTIDGAVDANLEPLGW